MGRFAQGDIHHSKVGIGWGIAALIQMMEEKSVRPNGEEKHWL